MSSLPETTAKQANAAKNTITTLPGESERAAGDALTAFDRPGLHRTKQRRDV